MPDAEDPEAPTFGDLINTPIDVSAALSTTKATRTPTAASTTTIAAPSLSSLATVLSQALRTDDAELLESCFAVANPSAVRATIERLDSGLAGSLLTKLSTRIHRRPGRAGALLQWVQWTLVAHGGSLASQGEVMEKLAMLQKVLAERSRGLNSLLVLKGKLDLLELQMQMRKRMQGKDGRRGADEDDEENVIWVEGQDADVAHGAADDDEEIDEVPAANGILGDSDEEDDDEELNEEDDDEDDDDEDDVDHSDVEDSGDEDDSDNDAAPPSKVRKTGNGFTKSR